jgi:acyl-CoA synthetase (AMP-forming)/AMP-acid ligase II
MSIKQLLTAFLFSGAAPLTLELVDALWNRLQIPVTQGYGMTELTGGTFLQVSSKLNIFIDVLELIFYRDQKTGKALSEPLVRFCPIYR